MAFQAWFRAIGQKSSSLTILTHQSCDANGERLLVRLAWEMRTTCAASELVSMTCASLLRTWLWVGDGIVLPATLAPLFGELVEVAVETFAHW